MDFLVDLGSTGVGLVHFKLDLELALHILLHSAVCFVSFEGRRNALEDGGDVGRALTSVVQTVLDAR